MRVAVIALEAKTEPRIYFYPSQVVAMLLQPAFLEVGPRCSEMRTLEFYQGQVMLFPRKEELWVRTQIGGVQMLEMTLSDAALSSAWNGMVGEVALFSSYEVVDPRIRAMVNAVNAERIAGFPSGELFLDSVERALAAALVDSYTTNHRKHPTAHTYRGGLGPARLRKIKELVHAKLEGELTLHEMAKAVGLSIAHFSQMFRRSTGQSPHQFVLRHRIERAKEMLQANRVQALDIAIACGFKTQQHFSRVFRQISGVTPRQYRQEIQR
jgi:AraC family transcriptional regulator